KTGLRPGELAHLLIEDLDLDTGWLHVRGKPELGWRIKTGRDRSVPLIGELIEVLGGLLSGRFTGLVFLRPNFDPASLDAALDRAAMAARLQNRLADEQEQFGRSLTRPEQARLARSVWTEAGAIDPDRIRTSFIRITRAIGHPEATCPK